tara:strand:+ start:7408 stop:7977 length:570 start_codon:yes stop_codon:yes gene_type:complete
LNDLNLCQFIGRLGNSAEVRYMQNGKAVANFSIACNRSWKDQQGQKQEMAEWIKCTAYDKLAEIIGQYTEKGSQLYVSGRQATRKWQDQSGQDRYATEIIVDQMQMLGGRQGGAQNNSGFQQGSHQGSNQAGHRPNNSNTSYGTGNSNNGNAQGGQQKAPPMSEPDFPYDDDIPFAPLCKQYRSMYNAC